MLHTRRKICARCFLVLGENKRTLAEEKKKQKKNEMQKIQQHCVSVIEGIKKKNNKNAMRNHLWK